MTPQPDDERSQARRTLSYAIRFTIECDDEPTEENLKRVLGSRDRPPRPEEYPAIGEYVVRYRNGEVTDEPPPPPRTWVEEMTNDPWWYARQVKAFEGMDRDQLPREACNWAWNARLWKLGEIQARKAADWMLRDNAVALQRAWTSTLARGAVRRSAPVDLGIALGKCEMFAVRYATHADGRYLICDECQADKDKPAWRDPPVHDPRDGPPRGARTAAATRHAARSDDARPGNRAARARRTLRRPPQRSSTQCQPLSLPTTRLPVTRSRATRSSP